MQSVEEQPIIRVRNLSRVFNTRRGKVRALDNVSLDVRPGEIMVLLGPSGCGKTTLLRCVAGLERPDEGEVTVRDAVVASSDRGVWVPPEKRGLSMVFQSYALWPHMTVFDNVAYPLRNRRLPAEEVQGQVTKVLGMVALSAYQSSYPGQLSGGQQQRVALARALVASNGIILFDEPLSNLDAKVRERIRVEMLSLHRDIGFTALYVTHDQSEAAVLADRIVVMDAGRPVQVGSPERIYDSPASRYVADFMGSANEFEGELLGFENGLTVVKTKLGNIHGRGVNLDTAAAGSRVVVSFRADKSQISTPGSEPNTFACVLKHRLFFGSHRELLVEAAGVPLVVRSLDQHTAAAGDHLCVRVSAENVSVFAA